MDRWLKRSVLSEFSRVPGRSGLYYKNLATGEEFGVRQDEAFLAASVIKLPVFAAVAGDSCRGVEAFRGSSADGIRFSERCGRVEQAGQKSGAPGA